MIQSSLSCSPTRLARRREVVSLKIEDPKNSTSFLRNLTQYGIKPETDFDQDDKEEISLQNIWNVFAKKERRTLTDNQIIINYLQTMTDFVDLIKRSLNNDYRMVIELLTQISFYLNYEKFDRNKLLFKFGDRGDKFYIILNGSVDVLIPKSRKVKITEMDYLYYLAVLDQYDELDLLKACLQDNIFNYKLDFTQGIAENKPRVSLLNTQVMSKKNSLIRMSIFNRQKNFLSDEIRRRFSTLLDLEKQRKEISIMSKIEQSKKEDDESSVNSTEKNITDHLSCSSDSSSSNESYISNKSSVKETPTLSTLRNKVKSLDMGNGKKFVSNISTQEYIDRLKVYKEITYQEVGPTSRLLDVVIYEYTLVSTLTTGNRFGDIALNSHNHKRSATIIIKEETHLAFLDKEHYLKCIFESNEKVKKANIAFLTSNTLFKQLNRDYFDKKYYNYFNYVSYDRQFTLTQENQEVNKVYFLKEGEYEVTMNRSLSELTEIIKKISKNNLDLNLIPNWFDKNESHLCKINPFFKKFYNNKRIFRIRIIKGKDTIGLRDVIIDKKCLFNIECISTHCEFFTIDKQFFNEIYENVYEVTESTDKFLKTKINLLVEKLIKLREVKIEFFHKSSVDEEGRLGAKEISNVDIEKIKLYKTNDRNIKMFLKTNLDFEENFKLHNIFQSDVISDNHHTLNDKKLMIPKKLNVSPEKLKIALKQKKINLKKHTDSTPRDLDLVKKIHIVENFSDGSKTHNTLTSSPDRNLGKSNLNITFTKDINDNNDNNYKIFENLINEKSSRDSPTREIKDNNQRLYQLKSSHSFLKAQLYQYAKFLPNTLNKSNNIFSKLASNINKNNILSNDKYSQKFIDSDNTLVFRTPSRNFSKIKEMQKLSFSLNEYNFLPTEESIKPGIKEVSSTYVRGSFNENKKNYKEAVSSLINTRARILYSPEKSKLLRRLRSSKDKNMNTIDRQEQVERKRDNLIKQKETIRIIKAKHSLYKFNKKFKIAKPER